MQRFLCLRMSRTLENKKRLEGERERAGDQKAYGVEHVGTVARRSHEKEKSSSTGLGLQVYLTRV